MQISAGSRKSVKLLAFLSKFVSRSLFPSLGSHTWSCPPRQLKCKLKVCHSLSMICFILNKSLTRFVCVCAFTLCILVSCLNRNGSWFNLFCTCTFFFQRALLFWLTDWRSINTNLSLSAKVWEFSTYFFFFPSFPSVSLVYLFSSFILISGFFTITAGTLCQQTST